MTLINCTLIVQAINFFIAFLIIKYCFFKPVVAEIHAEDALQESLMNTVQARRKIVAEKEQELLSQWQSAQQHFEHNTPSLRQEPFFSTKPSLVKPHFDHRMVDDVAKRVATELIKRVDHVR